MSLSALVAALTDKGGIVAAVVVVLGIVATVLVIVRPASQRRRDARAGRPALQFADLRVADPPPWSEAGGASFQLLNTGGGRAVMTGLFLQVLEHGPSEKPRMVEAAAPVPRYTYKVTLDPATAEYDVRQREFDTEPPHSFDAREAEDVLVELRSRRPQWYRLLFVARWYDAARPADRHETRSEPLRIEFRPDIDELDL